MSQPSNSVLPVRATSSPNQFPVFPTPTPTPPSQPSTPEKPSTTRRPNLLHPLPRPSTSRFIGPRIVYNTRPSTPPRVVSSTRPVSPPRVVSSTRPLIPPRIVNGNRPVIPQRDVTGSPRFQWRRRNSASRRSPPALNQGMAPQEHVLNPQARYYRAIRPQYRNGFIPLVPPAHYWEYYPLPAPVGSSHPMTWVQFPEYFYPRMMHSEQGLPREQRLPSGYEHTHMIRHRPDGGVSQIYIYQN